MAKKATSSMPTSETKKVGRPEGAPNREYLQADAPPSKCPSCGSTERGPYVDKNEQAIVGEHDGKPYTHVVWRGCRCLKCNQWRRDRSFENRSE
ncbi:hypothetical protein [Schlesneria paludicola]|uniref:hypothetical protein n=1 Tax=Schlesneria paludicola TaxID=360056 RepID=UPI000299EF77|nr:hypothetical protein [Schlesneria paludicola]